VRLGATLIKDADVDIVAQFEAQGSRLPVPQGSARNTPPDVIASGRAPHRLPEIAVGKDPGGGASRGVSGLVTRGTEELVALCQDPNASSSGRHGEGFAMQLELIAATVNAYPADEQVAQLARYVEQFLRDSWEQFERGAAGWSAGSGLKFAALSQSLYPNLAEHRNCARRSPLANMLDRKAAVLRAFFAAASGTPS